MAPGDDLAIDHALDLPHEQRVHVLATLLELVGEPGALSPAQVLAIVDRCAQVAATSAWSTLPDAVVARLLLDRDRARNVALDAARADLIAALVLVAPLLSVWPDTLAPRHLAALAPWMSPATRTSLLAAPPLPGAGLEDLLVGLAPFLGGADLRRARSLSMSASPPAIRALVVRALDEQAAPPRYYGALDPLAQARFSSLRWWPIDPTIERCRELGPRLAALAIDRRGPALDDAIARAFARVAGVRPTDFPGALAGQLRPAPSIGSRPDVAAPAPSGPFPRDARELPGSFGTAPTARVSEEIASPALAVDDVVADADINADVEDDIDDDVFVAGRGGGGTKAIPERDDSSLLLRPFDDLTPSEVRAKITLGDAIIDAELDLVDASTGPAPQRVMLGFADREHPARAEDLYSLVVGRPYWLWVEIGPHQVAGAIGGGEALPSLDAGDELDVVVFGFPGQLEIDDSQRHGAIVLRGARPGVVSRAAARPVVAPPLDTRRLFFPIATPATPGRYGLRVNVYFRNLLLQSHHVTAVVAKVPTLAYEPYTRHADYAITHAFELSALARAPAHQLSILLNDNGDGTHGFRFFGGAGFVEDATIDPVALGKLIGYARGALREVAWGTRKPWESLDKTPYRYDAPTAQQVGDDLIKLARHGYRLWGEALAAFGVRGPRLRALQDLMRVPAPLQIALKQSAAHVFPIALVYDHPLSTTTAAPTICPRFARALAAGEDLLATECFRGRCPSWGDERVVCASGFWGFRHDIGVPLHLGDRGEVATSVWRGGGRIQLMAGVSTDPELRARATHLGALARIAGITVDPHDDHDGCMDALAKGDAQVAYFYCHGGLTEAGTPYLEVGPPRSEPIVSDSLINKVWWEPQRPLVFLNGCHTTAATPEQTFDLVQGFVIHANAAGVIGTEITIFEPLATRFGEVFVGEFVGGASVGAAIRHARLALLRDCNPLGLVYLPFALATLKLADA